MRRSSSYARSFDRGACVAPVQHHGRLFWSSSSNPAFQGSTSTSFSFSRRQLSPRQSYTTTVKSSTNTHRISSPKAPLSRIRNMSSAPQTKSLSIDNINPRVKAAKYAVRGLLAIKSEEYRAALKKGEGKDLPFDTVISANIGNPQQLDQKPITFFRQVASLLENPQLLQHEDVLISSLGYKKDVVERAKWLLSEVNSVGAYSQSMGAPGIRQSVANFIERRDGYPADPSHIYLSAGASAGVNAMLSIICATPKTGVLVPIPQYPLYTATLAILGSTCVPYYLDEDKAWGTNLDAIKTAYASAQQLGIDTRAIAIINPGNPTGSSLKPEEVKEVLKFAAEEKLVVIADEVYQTNVFIGEFYSFKKGLRDLQKEEAGKYDNVELVSLHSVSKGMVGECGHRGGYYELVGFDPKVVAELYKFVSIQLCPPVIGQCIVECMVHPPVEGEDSYPLYKQEYDGIYKGLHERANALYEAFKQMEGVHCQTPAGSMYLFPTITLPEKAIAAAKEAGNAPDEFYCLKLLESTGVCVVPGSGFGQKEGTLHFRTTFLAPGTDWTGRIVKFHKEFLEQYK